MSAGFPGGPAELVLTASVARRYYLDGKSKVEIADEFSLSRFKVARLIQTALTAGIVRIEIGYPGTIDVELSGRLQTRYGLRHAVVVDTLEEDAVSLHRNLGEAAADLLTEIVTPDDVLGLAWARSVAAMTVALTRLAPVPIVQLTGALARAETDDSSIDLVRAAARVSGGPAHFFHAPLVVPNAATARAMRKQPEIARAFGLFGSVTKAVVGVGRWAAGQSTIYDAAEERDRKLMRRLGTCAEISGVTINAEGQPVHAGLSERMIGISAPELRAIPEVIAIAYGVAKAPAARAVLRSGLVSGLVTHTTLATALLADD
ncbi:sugar-binding transcriptional regulator [Planosporangium mesophilum]|uniref:Transcriptional regulator n=1 Tax=Planosporangium mesophilum TaxID=689768 RepID=A0A8J3WZV0_9ACTN|nr:sugar-binding domain-containing protein [Planosporangium mesophilum]NJC83934.1 transcriptional regulator [Planosporangium mesophilum]GII22700.1 transcriptional regulator [Planosporangium mesophilum]